MTPEEDTAELKFDVKRQRCLVYRNIKSLEDLLRNELASLATGQSYLAKT